MTDDSVGSSYTEDETSRLELIWGEGFMSPGGPAEVARIVAGRDLSGREVLDIGCGIGGVDLVLVRDHYAGRVAGVDVQQSLLDIATERARRAGLNDRVHYQSILPGHLPFPDESFDVVFSKDAIVHVSDKAALYAEAFRVLRPGGELLVGDWLRGHGAALTPQVNSFVTEAGHDFVMWTLPETGESLAGVGFTEIEMEDRHGWYRAEAERELDHLLGPMRAEFVRRHGDEAMENEVAFWRVMVQTLAKGALRPGHVRARKPHASWPNGAATASR